MVDFFIMNYIALFSHYARQQNLMKELQVREKTTGKLYLVKTISLCLYILLHASLVTDQPPTYRQTAKTSNHEISHSFKPLYKRIFGLN